jgi:hypothetical protein
MAAVGQSGPAAGKRGYITGALAETLALATQLARDEFALAGAELSQSARRLVTALVLTIVGSAFLLAGIVASTVAAVAGLALVVPIWVAAASVAGAVILIGGVTAATGIILLRRLRIVPERTVKSLTATVEWIKERVD